MDRDLAAFGENIASLDISETELAIAILWFLDQQSAGLDVRAADLAKLMHELSLRGTVNVSRLARNLAASRLIVRGKTRDSFKLKLASKPKLAERYHAFLKRPIPSVESHIVSSDDFLATRRYLEALVFQINGTYQFGFYDGCIVLCRRLMETLLIEAFEQAKMSAAIKKGGNYMPLSEIIVIARSGQHLKLARGTADALEEIKKAGDAAAHSRTYITSQRDIDDLRLTIRRSVSELLHLADIQPGATPPAAR